jgi:hypothetical protein
MGKSYRRIRAIVKRKNQSVVFPKPQSTCGISKLYVGKISKNFTPKIFWLGLYGFSSGFYGGFCPTLKLFTPNTPLIK